MLDEPLNIDAQEAGILEGKIEPDPYREVSIWEVQRRERVRERERVRGERGSEEREGWRRGGVGGEGGSKEREDGGPGGDSLSLKSF